MGLRISIPQIVKMSPRPLRLLLVYLLKFISHQTMTSNFESTEIFISTNTRHILLHSALFHLLWLPMILILILYQYKLFTLIICLFKWARVVVSPIISLRTLWRSTRSWKSNLLKAHIMLLLLKARPNFFNNTLLHLYRIQAPIERVFRITYSSMLWILLH